MACWRSWQLECLQQGFTFFNFCSASLTLANSRCPERSTADLASCLTRQVSALRSERVERSLGRQFKPPVIRSVAGIANGSDKITNDLIRSSAPPPNSSPPPHRPSRRSSFRVRVLPSKLSLNPHPAATTTVCWLLADAAAAAAAAAASTILEMEMKRRLLLPSSCCVSPSQRNSLKRCILIRSPVATYAVQPASISPPLPMSPAVRHSMHLVFAQSSYYLPFQWLSPSTNELYHFFSCLMPRPRRKPDLCLPSGLRDACPTTPTRHDVAGLRSDSLSINVIQDLWYHYQHSSLLMHNIYPSLY